MNQKHERPWLEGTTAAVGDTSEQADPIAPTPVVTTKPEAADHPEGAATIAPQELAATSSVLSDGFEREAPPADASRAFRDQDIALLYRIRRRLIGRLLIVCKFAGGHLVKPDALVGAAYIAMSAARATLAPDQAEILRTVMDLAIAMIYLAKPYLHKDERLQSRIEHYADRKWHGLFMCWPDETTGGRLRH